MFFQKKENQKTFSLSPTSAGVLTGRQPGRYRRKDRSFSFLFFKKESPPVFGSVHGLIPSRVDIDPSSATESSSFLKKRTKKLLSNADITMRETGWHASRYRRRDKSLLVLFFRKEHFLPDFLESQESISTRVGITWPAITCRCRINLFMNAGLHPNVSGGAYRVEALGDFIDYAKSLPDIRWATCEEIAD